MRLDCHTKITLAQYTVLIAEEELRKLVGPVQFAGQKKHEKYRVLCLQCTG